MNIEMRRITSENVHEAVMIWNKVVEDGVAFPQTEPLDDDTGAEFFASQDYTAVAFDTDTAEVVGMYILHPQQRGQMRSYLQRKLCSALRYERKAHRRAACHRLP